MKLKQYKISRRLGARIFPKCDNPKFTLTRTSRAKKHTRPMSEFGLQLIEKQKARYTYGLTEEQFSKYVKNAISRKGANSVQELYRLLESRLDNVVYRLGFARTRLFARQLVSHGHVSINGQKITIPSYNIKKGDVISIRKESQGKPFYEIARERIKEHKTPPWLTLYAEKNHGVVENAPTVDEYSGELFNLASVVEFYSR